MEILSDQEILKRLLNRTVTTSTTIFTTTTSVSSTTTSINTVSTLTVPQTFTLYQKWVIGLLVFVAVACLFVTLLVLVCLKQMCMPMKTVIEQ